jgi:hypothetical protein
MTPGNRRHHPLASESGNGPTGVASKRAAPSVATGTSARTHPASNGNRQSGSSRRPVLSVQVVPDHHSSDSRSTSVAPITDLQPFLIDPLIFARLHRIGKNGLRPSSLMLFVTLALAVALPEATALTGQYYRPGAAGSWGTDVWGFILRKRSASTVAAFPLLRDYPSLVMAFTIAISLVLVYALFCTVASLHSSMSKYGCIECSPDEREQLNVDIARLNDAIERWGRRWPLVIGLITVCVVGLNLRLNGRLYAFRGTHQSYADWWARLQPLTVGGVLWVLIGVTGVYVAYVEAVAGLQYVMFLRRRKQTYRFRPNVSNADGFYGFASLRRMVTNLEIGVICTLLSAWSMSFFLQPAIGVGPTILILGVFGGVVFYVFISINVNLRRQVRESLRQRRIQASRVIDECTSENIADLIRIQNSYLSIHALDRVPTSPIRQRFLVAGALSTLAPLSAIGVQVFRYFSH